MEDVVKSICCSAHGEVFVGKKRTRKRRGRKDGCWRERKKIVGMWGPQQANQEELLAQLRCTTGEARKKEIDLIDRGSDGESET
jgi:hypothetical protein